MLSILHVDYNFFYKEILKDIIEERNFEYFSVRTPREAFEVLKNKKIDLIITALEFKDKKGEDFIKSLNESPYKNIPVIVLSAKDDIETKNKLFNLGVIDFIHKSSFLDGFKNYIDRFELVDFADEQLKKAKIAVLDDNSLELMIIKKIFELNNITNVDYYNCAEELLNQMQAYSLYLIDFVLPSISGEQVILELRKKYKYALIIAISAIDNQKIISNILSSGADDYITKPFNENVFIARLKANIRTFLLLQELKEKNFELERMVKIDGLTSLYNHKYMYERLEEEIQRARRYDKKLSIIMFDIDKFKCINDVYGHQFGDDVLIKISQKLKSEIRQSDIAGRYGGEEFIIILPETGLQDAYKLAERLRKSISNIKFKEKNIKVTISGGVAELEKENALKLIGKSDKLLYKAKENGRNRIEKA
ncbi:diguanylate cyclase [Crassaminicella thermophila]|uniref:Stage 0 sporulation protein A homolog n=1 Tax=Crassaminicella thermophila TaxID=2599308 RepID=A0A5C0SIR8_CRATE|nr:diguanylate cyclase [Crassaminicella thermophila]QEK12839.1 diguanylate cyclase [Crassaminicella thermophila]